jgi:hypothetical protein
MPYPIIYHDLANHIGRLPLSATVADLCDHLSLYAASDPVYWASIVRELRQMPQAKEAMVGVMRLCELLHRDNPRFVTAIMTDWILEDV